MELKSAIPEAVPPTMSPRTGGGADIISMVIDLLEQEPPNVPEALRVAKGGLKLLVRHARASLSRARSCRALTAATSPLLTPQEMMAPVAPVAALAPAPVSTYTGPPHDRRLILKVGSCCELESDDRATRAPIIFLSPALQFIAGACLTKSRCDRQTS